MRSWIQHGVTRRGWGSGGPAAIDTSDRSWSRRSRGRGGEPSLQPQQPRRRSSGAGHHENTAASGSEPELSGTMVEFTRPDDYMVCVTAVVMTWDDGSGGWLAQDGDLSRVGVCRLLPRELVGRHSFMIHGERLRDGQVILEYFLKKDLVYTKATPTFHHWRVDNRKCGLTFQSPADARAFDRGMRKALEALTEGSTTSSSTLQNEMELGDDDVFMTATDSSSNSSQRREPVPHTLVPHNFSNPQPHCCILGQLYEEPHAADHLDQVAHMFPRHVIFHLRHEGTAAPQKCGWLTGYEDYRHANATKGAFHDPDSCVHFGKKETAKCEHTCPYPPGCALTPGCDTKPHLLDPGGASRAVVTAQPWKLQQQDEGKRFRCVYCQDLFHHRDNRRGRCQEAPDPIQVCIRHVSFLWCADSLLYHCMSDPEGEYSDPCSCDPSEERFCLRWVALLGLSVLAPCMCCYLPLTACYHCGVACRCCGGKHKAAG